MTLMLFNVVGGRVVEPTVPMMLFHCGGRWWVGNTASGIALLRRNGAAITSHVISPRHWGAVWWGAGPARMSSRSIQIRRGGALQCNSAQGCAPLCQQIAGAWRCAAISVPPRIRLVCVVAASACAEGRALMCGLCFARASEAGQGHLCESFRRDLGGTYAGA